MPEENAAVIYIGRKGLHDFTSLVFGYDHFTLVVNDDMLTSSKYATGPYLDYCEAEGQALGDLLLDMGVRHCSIKNGWVYFAADDAMHLGNPIPENGVRKFTEALTRPALLVS